MRGDRLVTLVAVSKTQPLSAILEAYEAGQRDFGESRLQEARSKIAEAPRDIRWHFIGTLQSNKARAVAEHFQVIHTLTNEGQLAEIKKAGMTIDGFIEVNIANEPQKGGLLRETLDGYLASVLNCRTVQFRGLMTIGPNLRDPEAMRPYFRELRQENERIGGQWLSMGMSDNFEVAIQEGASHVRVGTALFGAR